MTTRSKRFAILWPALVAALATGGCRSETRTAPSAGSATAGLTAAEPAPRKPLTVVLWLGGFAHDFKSVGAILSEVLPRQFPLKMRVAWNGDFLDAPGRPDVILMYHCHKSTQGVLTEAQKGKLLAMVKEGVGVVAVHASYYSFLKWDEYHKFYGARFIKHGKSEARLRVTPVEKEHPVFKGLDKPFELVSELYQSTALPADCDVLAHSRERGKDKSQPSVWTRAYGKGRIVTILPGHWADNFREALFQRLILNSMIWVVEGKVDHDWQEHAVRSFTLPEGFEISLVAAEPHLANPISMTLDEAGRIYVSNAHSYRRKWWRMTPPPAREPSNPVVRLTLGPDGRAVEATVVAEGFEHPVMGLAVRGKRLWATSLNRVFVTDLDEKGRMVGERKVLVHDAAEPWNPFGMYRVVFGPDDFLYLSIGDHATRLTGADGQAAVRLDNNGSGAVFRFRDDGSELELLIEGMRAPFTLGITPFGRLWVITNGEGSPNCLLDAVRGTDYRFRKRGAKDWAWLTGAEKLAAPAWETAPGAHTAVLPYYSSAFPEEYWGNLFVSNFGVHGAPARRNEVLRLILDERGHVLRQEVFVSSSDPMFRPTQVSLAPDGSLYLLDWYGKDDENDLTGRLYRIRYTGKKAWPEIGSGLGSRNHARRRESKVALLAAGSASSLPVLDKALAGEDALAAAEALWTLRCSGWASAADHISKAFSHADWRVRRLAVQLLRETGKQEEESLQKLLNDPDPAVRLEAALGFRGAPARCKALIQALRGGAAKIRRLRFAAALEIARHGQYEHFAALLADPDPDMRLAGLIALDEAFYESSKGFKTLNAEERKQLAELERNIAALKAQLRGESSGQLAAFHRSTAPELKQLREELKNLEQKKAECSAKGVAPALTARKVLAHFIAEPGKLASAELLDLARRWPHAELKPTVHGRIMVRLGAADVSTAEIAQGLAILKRMGLPTSNATIDKARTRLLDEAAAGDIGKTSEKLAVLKVLEAGDAKGISLPLLKRFIADENARVRALAYSLLSAASRAGDAAAVALCHDLAVNDKASLAPRLDAIVTLARLEKTPDKDTWTGLLLSSRREIALAALRSLQNCTDRAAALRILEAAAARLRKQHGPVVADDLAFTTAALTGRNVAGTNKTSLRRKVLADGSAGTPELGRLVFRTRACYGCHAADGNAGVLAPQLDHIAAYHDAEYLLDSILYPDRIVKTGFLSQMITLRNGKVVTGILRRNVSGDGRYDEVIDSTGRRTLYRSREIKSVKAVSVMPPGLEATMSRTELVDLIAYLKTLK